MIIYGLPKSVMIAGKELAIRYDYRVALEIIQMLQDTDLSTEDKGEALLTMFYVNPEEITDYKQAVKECFLFLNCGKEDNGSHKPKLVDWEQDFEFIIAPINRVLGYEVRGVEYDVENNTGGLHWWTFISAYMEIGGDCTLAQIINIRSKLKKGSKLEKHEKQWYRQNADIVNMKTHYSDMEKELLKEWTGG